MFGCSNERNCMLVLVESRVWFYYCNMKKLIIILSAVFIIPFVVFAENQSIFGIDDNGFVYAGHDIVYQNLIDLEIPQYIDGKEVTGIREKAFAGYKNIRSVTIPDSVVDIGPKAFYGCGNLESIDIPNGVVSIGSMAFCDCTSLKEVIVPFSVEEIGERAFCGCSNLENVLILGNIKEIEPYIFYWCFKLSSIFIPPSVTNIGEGAFSCCFRLEDVYIPNSVTYLGDMAFEHTRLESVYIPDSVEYIGNNVFRGCFNLKDISVSEYNKRYESIEGILFDKKKGELIRYPAAKEGAIYLVPNYINSIASCAFYDCSNIVYIEIGDNVSSIGSDAFRDCSKLRNIYVSDNNKNYKSVDGVLFDKKSGTLILYPSCKLETEYAVPNSVAVIGTLAFSSCSNLSEITIPDSVSILK